MNRFTLMCDNPYTTCIRAERELNKLMGEVDKLRQIKDRLLEENARLQAERDSFEYELLAVMHSVDKWLEGKDLKDNPATRAATAREVALRASEKIAAERDKAVEDITNIINNYQKYIKERDKNN